jgi:predicted O-linked N-acetylglucosamine transferase (SPINDLY family)
MTRDVASRPMAGAQNPIPEIIALHGAGRFPEMEQRARAALKQHPGVALLDELLGIALTAQRRDAEALTHLEKAARATPADPQFWENLGLCQRVLRRFADAEQSLRRSLGLRPQAPDALNALGSVLRSLKKPGEARAMFERAVMLAPQMAGAHFNLAKSYLELGEWAAAEAALRETIRLDPGNVNAHASLADFLFGRERRGEAEQAALHALQLLGGPEGCVTAENVLLFDTLAMVFDGLKRYGTAFAICKATYAFKPEPARALEAAFVARRVCEWEFAAAAEPEALKLTDGDLAEDVGPPWFMLSLASATAADQRDFARKFSQKLANETPFAATAAGRPPGPRRARMRIGYLSADYFSHPTAALIAGVIEGHDRARFEIIGYDMSPPKNDAYRHRLEAAFDRLVPIRDLNDEAAARRIADEGSDIVIDVNGWTLGNRQRVLLRRPAPVQIQWLGYAGTLGAPWIDYVIADPVLIRPEEESFYSEKVIRLPDTYQPNDDRREIGAAVSRLDAGLPESAFVFCCFNQTHKITADIFDVWMQLLRDVPGSVLWLLAPQQDARATLSRRIATSGIDAGRVIFAPVLPGADHLARLALADLALDCFPYGSHTTASDALYAGVPLVALKGDTFASRVSASILTAADLHGLIAASLSDYRDLAFRLATDAVTMNSLRARMSGVRASALFDTARFTRNLEAAYDAVWERRAAGLPPAPVDVA